MMYSLYLGEHCQIVALKGDDIDFRMHLIFSKYLPEKKCG